MFHRLLATCCVLLSAAAFPGCRVSGGKAPAGGPEGGAGSGRSPSFAAEGAMTDLLEDTLVFLGANVPASRALSKIRDVHDLKDWSHRLDVPDAVGTCRDAIRALGEADYETWDQTAISVWVLSTMAVNDPSSLVRDDCLGVLSKLRAWIHPDAAAVGQAVRTTEEDVARALRVLPDLHRAGGAHAAASDRLVCSDAIAVLGSHPWDDLPGDDPATARTRLARPRGVIRVLTAPSLAEDRKDPLLRDILDRSLLRVADQTIFLTLVAGLADRGEHVRAAAARALAAAGDPRACGPLARTLGDESRDSVKMELCAALGTLGGGTAREASIQALGERLPDPAPSVRRAAARALDRVTGEDRAGDPVEWLRWWRARSVEATSR